MLKLSNFRNHKAFKLEVEKDIIAIYGKNGSGKTNILEAISLASAGRGIRGAKLSDMSFFDGASQHPWGVFMQAEGAEGEVEIGTSINVDVKTSSDNRIVKINGEKQRGQNRLCEYISIFSLTPAEDQTFADGSTTRREFLDKICNFFYSNYASLIGAFNNLKSQRRNLLINGNNDFHWLDSIESQMSEKAIAISNLRNEAVINLNKAVSSVKEYGFPTANISILGDVENFMIENKDKNPEIFYKEALKKNRGIDSNSGRTNEGPHRSDLRVIHEQKNMPAELCSQGEQKAMLLTLTIAAVIAKKNISGQTPILLLDEVYAHLDEQKRAELYNFISHTNCQTWLTGTEKQSFEELKDCQFVGL